MILAFTLVLACACGVDEPAPGATACAPGSADALEDYDTFGEGFLAFHCQGCHASTQVDRLGAPVDVTFDTEASALGRKERILARAGGDAPTMPPAGGTTEEERAQLARWLSCAPDAR